MMRKIIYICTILVLLSTNSFSQPKSSLDQVVSMEHPDSAPSCLAFIFKACQIENDSKKLLAEFELVKDKGIEGEIKFVNDYLNSKKELTAEVKQLNPIAFKEFKKYAILLMKRDPSANPHFVVFCGWKKELFLLYDPNGTLHSGVIETEVFLNQYQGTALIISPSMKENSKNHRK